MIRATRIAKRGLSWLLTLAMLLSLVGVTAFAAGEDAVTVSKSELILKAYGDELSAAEQAVVKKLITGEYTYVTPDGQNKDGLIEITESGTTKSFTAKDYKDSKGNTWTPAKAFVTVNGETTEVDLAAGSFEVPEETPYSFTVTYAYDENISAETADLAAALKTPAQLARGLKTMTNLNNLVVGSLKSLTPEIPKLADICENGYEIGPGAKVTITSQEMIDAVAALNAQLQENGGLLTITALMNNGGEDADISVANLLKNGEALAAENANILKLISDIKNSDAWHTLNDFSDKISEDYQKMLNTANKVFATLVDDAQAIDETDWLLDEDVKALLADKSDAELAELTELAKKIGDADANKAFRVADTLTVANADVTVDVGMTLVIVKVEATVVLNDENEVGPAEPAMGVAELRFPTGTKAADVLAKIDEINIIDKAEYEWSKYEVNDTNYDVKTTELPSELGEETVNYTITYTPKEFSYKIADEDAVKVPFGYTLTLPKHEDEKLAYDYTIEGKAYFQGETYRITKDVVISRTEGKAYQTYELDNLAARAENTGLGEDAKTVLNNPALKTDTVKLREPAEDDKLVTVAYEGGVYNVTAQSYNSSLNGKNWVPVEARALDDEGTVLESVELDADGKGAITVADFARIVVIFKLELENADVKDQIGFLVGLPAQLSKDAAAQKDALSKLTDGAVMNDFGKLDKENLNNLRTAINSYRDEVGPELVAGVQDILDHCVAPDNSLILYNYLNSYLENGLGYFFANDTAIQDQIKSLNKDLTPAIGNDGLYKALDESGYADYWSRIQNVIKAIQLADQGLQAAPVSNVILRTSSSLADLAAALEKEIPEVAAPETLVLTAEIPAEVPGRSTLTVNVNLRNSDGDVKATATKTFTYPTGTAMDTAKQNAAIDEMIAKLSGEDKAYYTEQAEARPSGALNANTTYTVNLDPTQYTVKLVEDGKVINETFATVAVDKLNVKLPASEDKNFRFDYSFNGEKLSGESFNLKKADLKEGLSIERKTIDVLNEDLLTLVDALNKAVIDGGMTAPVGGSKTGCVSFILDKTDGNYSLIARVTPSGNLKRTAVIGSCAKALSGSGLYIGIEGEDFWLNSEMTIQAVVDMLLKSGFGMETILNVIDKNGDIVEMVLPTAASTGKAASTEEVISKNPTVYRDDVLGGKLLETELQVGAEKTGAKTVKFYVTLEDFDAKTSTLKTLRSNVSKLYRYFDVEAADGAATLTVKNGPAYKAYISAALAAGYADIHDMSTMDHEAFITFLFDYVKQLVADENIDLETYTNTAGEVGIEIDLSRYENYYEYLRKVANEIISNSEVDSTNGLKWDLRYTNVENMVKKAMNKANVPETMRNCVTDKEITYAVSVVLPDVDYVALVITPNESNRNKISYASNAAELQTILDENGRKTAVILLKDLDGSITINKSVVLDLNGKTVNGDLNVSGRSKNAVIVDSTWSNTGKVTGAVNGTKVLKITGGSYSADVNAYLPNDYFVSPEGKVINRFYETAQEGDDIIFYLNADRITLYGIPSWKAMAVELAFDLALNFYSAGSMTVAGNELYSAQLDDLVELVLSLSGEKAANEAIDAMNLEGINGLIKLLANDFTHLEKLQGNLNGDLFTYDFSYNKWELSFEKDDSDNSLVMNLQPGDETVEGKVIIRLKEYGEYNLNGFGGSIEEIDALLEKMVPVTTINEVSASLNGKPAYASRTLKVSGNAKGDVEFDLRDDPNYAIALGVILAKGANDNADLIAAIEKFYEDGTLTDLKAAMEAVSNAEALKAFQLLRRGAGEDVFADFVKDLGLDGTVSQDCIDLARTYRAFLVTIGTAIAKSGIEGSSTELGSYEMGETGDDYGSYKVSKSGSKHLTKTVRGYTLDLTGMLESSTLILRIFKEENVIVETFDENGDSVTKYRTTDENPLNKAFEEAKDGWTIKIYDYVDLTADVEIPADTKIELVGAEFIGFAPTEGEFTGGEETSFVIILNVGSEIKSDFRFEPMEDYFKSADDRYTVQMREEDGKYIYFLQGVLVETFDENGESVTKYFIGEENALNKAFEEAKDGWTIKVYDYVDLTADVEIPADTKIEVIGAEFMGFAPVGGEFTEGEDTAFFIILNLGSEVKTDFEFDPKEDYFKSADDNYSVQVRDEYVYFLESNVLVEVLDENGNVVASYKFGDEEALNKAFDEAKDGYTIKVYGDVELTEDKTLDREISIETENDAEVKLSATITLTEDGVLTSDVELDKSKFVPEDEEKYELDEDAIGNGPYTYKLKEKEVPQPEDPEIISVPAPTGDKMAAKMTEDEEGNYFLLIDLWNVEVFDDMDFVGFITPEDLADAIDRDKIEVKNGVVKSVAIEGGVTNEVSGQTWVPTGATLIVTAENPETGVTVERRIIIVSLGDTNCNGWNESNDALLIEHHYMKATGLDDSKTLLEGYALMAADVNQKGEEDAELTPDGVESNDAYLIEVKYVHNGDYVSALA